MFRERRHLPTQLGPAYLLQLTVLTHTLILEHDRRVASGIRCVGMAEHLLHIVELRPGNHCAPGIFSSTSTALCGVGD